LSVIPEQNDVIIDFSLCEFVDHSVMENINDYQELFYKKGGNIGIIGLDILGTKSEHPFALRRLLPFQNIIPKNNTKRQKNLEQVADDFGLSFAPSRRVNNAFLENFIYFKTKKIEHVFNRLSAKKHPCQLFDIIYSEGEFIAKEVIRSTMLYIKTSSSVPVFKLDREGLLERLYALAGYKDIDIKNHVDFSKRFYLRGENERDIRAFFTDELVLFFESNAYYHIESSKDGVLIFGKERIASIKEIKALLDFGFRLNAIINKS